MTLFIDVNDLGKLINQVSLPCFMQELLSYMQADFKQWPQFDKSARTAAHSEVGVIELMPIANASQFSFKYVNGHPNNPQFGYSTVMAFGALADVASGYPLLLSELTLATAVRTAVTSVLAAKALANPEAKTMAMIGCGAQSEFQAIAFHCLMGITELRIFDIDEQAMDKLEHHLKAYPQLSVIRCTSSAVCCQRADIITTVTADKNLATILTSEMVTPGVHINGVGGDCPGKTEISLEVLKAAKIFVEHEPQTRIEGDIQQLPADHPVYPLWQVLTGEIVGRDSAEQVTIFDSVGFALEDFSTLRYVYDLARQHGVGQTIELVPKLANPKDLFALIKQTTFTQSLSHCADAVA